MIQSIRCEICGYRGKVVGLPVGQCPCPHDEFATVVPDGQEELAVDEA